MGALQGLSGAMKGGAQSAAGRAERDTAYYNADKLQREAKVLGSEGAENQLRMRAMQGVAVGQEVARTGASGVERSGSARQREVSAATRFEQEVNDLAAQSLQKVSAMQEQAQMERWKGRQAARAGKGGGLGSLLGGVMDGGATIFNAFN